MNILKDKVIVVVGASSGIGAAISEYFCDHGAITCIFGRRKNDWKNYATGQKKRIKGCILIQVTREITAISPEWQNKLSDVLGK